MYLIAMTGGLAFVLLAPLVASTSPVQVARIPPRPVCGDALRPAARATMVGGLRFARLVDIRVRRADGRVWWHRTFFATTSWRRFQLPSGYHGRCRPTTVIYRGLGWRRTFRVSFRRERDCPAPCPTPSPSPPPNTPTGSDPAGVPAASPPTSPG